jgi:hypothetical protein
MKSTIFWYITLCSPLKVNRRFGGTYRLHHQGRIRRARYQSDQLANCVHRGILFGLFYPEDAGDMFLRNVGLLSADYTVFREVLSVFIALGRSQQNAQRIWSNTLNQMRILKNVCVITGSEL